MLILNTVIIKSKTSIYSLLPIFLCRFFHSSSINKTFTGLDYECLIRNRNCLPFYCHLDSYPLLSPGFLPFTVTWILTLYCHLDSLIFLVFCVVFWVSWFSYCVLCAQCYQCLWIVHSWLSLRFSERIIFHRCLLYTE